ncbi:MAG: hypothetical protein J1F64_01040 [Oscillospiraceae bacterium]|nr:hypothetical protein [Oscillospiraceae bacterium]
MNWSEAKSILIVFFLVINMVFLGILIESDRNKYNVNADIMKASVDILNKAQITIGEDIIPKKNPKMKYAEAYNIIEDNMIFAKSLIGGDAYEAEGKYISPAGEAVIDGDFFSAVYYDKDYFDIAGIYDIENKIQAVFKKLDFDDMGNYETEYEETENGGRITIKNIIEAKPFFDSRIEISMTGQSVEKISGVWFVSDPDMISNMTETKSITGVLIDFKNMYDGELPVRITGLNIGYYKGKPETYHKSFVLIPVWCIETSDGGVYYMDTRRTR